MGVINWNYIFFLFFIIIVFPIYAILFNDNYIDILLISISIYFMRLTDIYIISTRLIENSKSILPRALPYNFDYTFLYLNQLIFLAY